MITILRKSFDEAYPEVLPMVQPHWAEINSHPQIPVVVNEDAYRAVEQQGNLLFLVIYVDEVMAGYCVFVLGGHGHHQYRWARNDAVFVLPKYRNRGVGLALINAAEQHLQAHFPCVISWHVPARMDWSVVLRARGYQATEQVMEKCYG